MHGVSQALYAASTAIASAPPPPPAAPVAPSTVAPAAPAFFFFFLGFFFFLTGPAAFNSASSLFLINVLLAFDTRFLLLVNFGPGAMSDTMGFVGVLSDLRIGRTERRSGRVRCRRG